MTYRVLVTDALAPAGLACLEASCQVDVRLGLSEEELCAAIGTYEALVVRSGTTVSADVVARGRRLRVVGRAGTGVDNVDVDAATRCGVLVVNAPTSNTIAVAEHTLALMLCLARNVVQANASVHAGQWQRGRFLGSELRDKTLGLVGLGRVGTAVAARARAFEMRLLAYDPLVSAERAAQLDVRLAELDELLATADYVSLHAPATERTRGMIGTRELALMKPGACLINCARGELVDEDALAAALAARRIAGAALDVYPHEPSVSPALRGMEGVLLTPHLGASTLEAQDSAAVEVARQVVDVLEGRAPRYPVNLSPLSEEERATLGPYLDLAGRLGRFCGQYAHDNISALEIVYGGEAALLNSGLLSSALLAGLLGETTEEPVNLVNARLLARERGLEVTEVRGEEAEGFGHLITLRAATSAGPFLVSGAVMRGQPHIVRVGDYWFDFRAAGDLLLSEHVEQPGIIGQMGGLLGELGVSIAFVQVGRQERGGLGLMILGLDDPLDAAGLARVMALPTIRSAHMVRL